MVGEKQGKRKAKRWLREKHTEGKTNNTYSTSEKRKNLNSEKIYFRGGNQRKGIDGTEKEK